MIVGESLTRKEKAMQTKMIAGVARLVPPAVLFSNVVGTVRAQDDTALPAAEAGAMRMFLTTMALWIAGCLQPAIQADIIVVLSTTFPVSLFEPIDLDGDGQTDFTFAYDSSACGLITERENRVIYFIDPLPNVGGPVQRLPEGFQIDLDLRDPDIGWLSLDPATIAMCFDTGCSSTWPPGSAQRGYIGLEFELADGVHYGYFDVNVSGSSPGIGIYGWGYETQAGAPIIAGAVPEPSSFMLVAAGATAIFLSRRKKRIR